MGVIPTGWMQVLIHTPERFGQQHGLVLWRVNERGCDSSQELNACLPHTWHHRVQKWGRALCCVWALFSTRSNWSKRSLLFQCSSCNGHPALCGACSALRTRGQAWAAYP